MKWTIDQNAINAAHISTESTGDVVTFTLPQDEIDPTRPQAIVKARTNGTDVEFFPERSSSHKTLLRLLGVGV